MPFSPGSRPASGSGIRPDLRSAQGTERLGLHAGPGPAVPVHVPRLNPGAEQLGEYQGSGLTEATYLVRNPAGQLMQVSRLLHLVLSGIDGRRTVGEIAAWASAAFGRTVSVGNVDYLLANKLAPLGLVDGDEGAHHAPDGAPVGQDPAVLALKLRRTLVPAASVQPVARLLQPLFNPVMVVAALVGLIASDSWLLRSGRIAPAFQDLLVHPLLLLLVLGLCLVSMLFHECGHAAACRYGGARPGVIGVGFYVIWPAFFTNVTDAYRLGRAGRVRTDLGGVYFNVVFVLALTGTYLATGYVPLVAAVVLVHLEMIQQLMPSLRFDGYFILADLIGVPDLFRRIGPTLRGMIPGLADPRVQGLKRAARVTLTTWVLLMVPLLGLELTLIILNGPVMVRTFGQSLAAQVHDVVAQFRRAEIAAGLVSVISIVLLVLPMAGLFYILFISARRALRSVSALNRQRPVLWLPVAAAVLIAAAVLAVHWGLLRQAGGVAASRPAAADHVTVPRHAAIPAQVRIQPRHARRGRRAVVLTAVSAHGFDPLDTLGDPYDENDALAGYAIDKDPATAWQSQYYLGNPVFGGLKTGSGLILDMGRPVRLSSVTVKFGPALGADVAIEIGNDDTLAASTLPTFSTVAAADGIGGRHTFRTASKARGRYVLIWFTRLPPAGPGKFQAQIFNIIVRGEG